jgi:hypothetical protein
MREVVPHVDEVIVIAVDISRSTIDSWKTHPAMSGKVSIIEVNDSSHPELYFKDEAGTYSTGEPLFGEAFKGPFSGQNIIADWSKVCNLGWKRCTQEWRLFVDSDEELSDGLYISSVCWQLNSHGIESGSVLNRRSIWGFADSRKGQITTCRLAKNGILTSWVGEARESLECSRKMAIIDGSLRIRQSDSVFSLDAQLNYFKTLYANARANNWNIAPCNLLYIAQLSELAGMPAFADQAISTYLDSSLYTEERAWACALRGQQFERVANYEQASVWYERSLAEHPGFKSAYRLCRSRHQERMWDKCLDAFWRGIENNFFVHTVDDGAESQELSLILAISALTQLGRKSEAREYYQILQQFFPGNMAIIRMGEQLNCK